MADPGTTQAPAPASGQPSGGGMGSAMLTALQNVVTAINGLASTLTAARVQVRGSFVLTGGSPSTVVAQIAVASGSTIVCFPLNAVAATTPIYLNSKNAGVGFTVSTGSGSNAAGTESYAYVVLNG